MAAPGLVSQSARHDAHQRTTTAAAATTTTTTTTGSLKVNGGYWTTCRIPSVAGLYLVRWRLCRSHRLRLLACADRSPTSRAAFSFERPPAARRSPPAARRPPPTWPRSSLRNSATSSATRPPGGRSTSLLLSPPSQRPKTRPLDSGDNTREKKSARFESPPLEMDSSAFINSAKDG